MTDYDDSDEEDATAAGRHEQIMEEGERFINIVSCIILMFVLLCACACLSGYAIGRLP